MPRVGQKLLAGTGARRITPPLGLSMAGFAAREGGSTGVHDDLWAKVLVLDGGTTAFAFISLDLIEVTLELTSAIRAEIAKGTGLPEDHILLATSHTHSGPEIEAIYRFAPGPVEYDAWLPTLIRLVAEAALDAWANRAPALLGTGATIVEKVGANRRGKDMIDKQVGLIKVERTGHRPLGVVFNYTCHASVLGPDNRLISADYPGYAQRGIEKALGGGALALFVNGAAGDINSGHSADTSAIGGFIPGRTFERAQELGERLAEAVVTAWPKIETTATRSLDVVSIPWEPKYRKDLPSPDEARRRIAELEQQIKQPGAEQIIARARIDLVYHQIMLQHAKLIRNAKTGTQRTEIQGIRLGETAVVTLPAEVFVQIGLGIKERSPFPLTLVAGYTNDALGYIPTYEALLAGGYESISTKFAAGTDEELADKALECLRQLRERAGE